MIKKEFNTLGVLEAKIMEIIWGLKNASVRDVLNNVKTEKKPAYTTIMTVMTRLYEKGILKRETKNDAYIYTPLQNKQDYLASTSKKIFHNLINEFGEDIAVAGFIDVMENNDFKKSKKLRQKLRKILK